MQCMADARQSLLDIIKAVRIIGMMRATAFVRHVTHGLFSAQYLAQQPQTRQGPLAVIAKERFAELLRSGPLDLTEVACSCPASTIGTDRCNAGRKCGILLLNGRNIGATLIAEELAMPFVCGQTRCRKMPDWPRIIELQFPSRR